MSGGWKTLRLKERCCPPAMPPWMRSCPAAAGRWAAWWRYCSNGPGSMSGNWCCRRWRRRSPGKRGRWCWWARLTSPSGPACRRRACRRERLLCVRAEKPAARLWAAEQALRCAEVAAVLAWLPQAKSAELRRLQMAAQQQRQVAVRLSRLECAPRCFAGPFAAAGGRGGHARAAHPQAPRPAARNSRCPCPPVPPGWRRCLRPAKQRAAGCAGPFHCHRRSHVLDRTAALT